MKKHTNFSLLILLILHGFTTLAQPSQTQVKNDFMKNGVTTVEGIIINKEWYKDHYLWKASFRTILPVKPEEVDGLKGVTMVRHVVAHYECGGSNCSKTWSGLAYSEYKGINLPAPNKEELAVLLKQQMTTDPSKLVRSMSSKVSFDSVKIDDPQVEWINPRKLQFAAKLYYKDNVSYTEIGVIESPLSVTLERPSIQSPLAFRGAYQYFEKNVELARYKANGTTSAPVAVSDVASPTTTAGAWKVGDKVMVEENGKWYPASVLQVRAGEWFIHYDGYDSKYDLWVGISHVKNK
jgi:RNA binding activity-knot of a chromodomain